MEVSSSEINCTLCLLPLLDCAAEALDTNDSRMSLSMDRFSPSKPLKEIHFTALHLPRSSTRLEAMMTSVGAFDDLTDLTWLLAFDSEAALGAARAATTLLELSDSASPVRSLVFLVLDAFCVITGGVGTPSVSLSAEGLTSRGELLEARLLTVPPSTSGEIDRRNEMDVTGAAVRACLEFLSLDETPGDAFSSSGTGAGPKMQHRHKRHQQKIIII